MRTRMSVWERTVQAWCCLGLLHRGETGLLADIVFGVEDWTTEAAIYALVVSAWTDPAQRAGVAALVAERFEKALAAHQTRPVLIATSLAQLACVTPDLSGDARDAARRMLAEDVLPRAQAQPKRTVWDKLRGR